ncbi:MAG: DHHA1 domain-containing protein, partial [Nevskia sp.]|nr:DHHA1 domain-containing protein [Nevskia sp.]
MALFGEKYGDEVRVVGMGGPDAGKSAWSVELCGGTHVRRTGDIGLFRIVSESAVSAGVRRIEAVCGAAALAQVEENERLLDAAAQTLHTSPADLPERVAGLMEERRRLEHLVADLQKKLATGGSAASVEEVGGVKLSAREVGDLPACDLKGIAEAIRGQLGSGVVALVSTAEGKASIVVGVSADLTGRVSAVDLVRAASAAVGGKGGGGRPDMAQAGGPDASKAGEALAAVRAALGEVLK